MKGRTIYQVITEAKSSPVGVDWLAIMAAKQAIKQRGYSQRPISEIAVLDRSKRQLFIHTESY